MAKLNRAQRIAAKIAGGMTHIEAEISIVQEDNAAKVASLKAKQEKEETKVRSVIVELLSQQHPDMFGELETKARAKLQAVANVRSSRASGARASVRMGEPQANNGHPQGAGLGRGQGEGAARPLQAT